MTTEETLQWLASRHGTLVVFGGSDPSVTVELPRWRGKAGRPSIRESALVTPDASWEQTLRQLVARVSQEVEQDEARELAEIDRRARASTAANMARHRIRSAAEDEEDDDEDEDPLDLERIALEVDG